MKRIFRPTTLSAEIENRRTFGANVCFSSVVFLCAAKRTLAVGYYMDWPAASENRRPLADRNISFADFMKRGKKGPCRSKGATGCRGLKNRRLWRL